MRITYYALRPLLVGEETRVPGDLVPEAQDWPYLSGYVSDCKLAPVLVATLPEEQQVMLLEWEEAVYGPVAVQAAVEGPVDENAEVEQTQTEDKTEAGKVVVKPKPKTSEKVT
jgi:hypothetical protein